METEANVPEDESATNFTLIESTTTTTEREEIKFPQKNGNDLNMKYPLVEEASQANSGKTGEISVIGPKEIYQNSSEANAESEKDAEHKPEGHSTEVLKNSNAEELVEMELIKKSSVPQDRALSTLPNIASIQVERVHESIRDEIQKELKSAVTDKKEQQESEKDFAEKDEVPEGFDLHEVTGKSCTENEKKDEPQSEAQSLETKDTKNPNLEKETTEVNSSNDTNEHEKVWESHLGERININDGGKFIKEEAKEMEKVTNMQFMETTTESILDNEAPILSTSAFVKGETDDEIFQKQTLKEEESATKENESCGPESKLEQATKAIEAIDPPEIMGNYGGNNEEQTDHRSEAPASQSEITKNSILEGFMTKESSTKSSYDIDKSGEIPDSHTIENSEIKDGEKSLLEETVYIKEPIDVELQKSEAESAPEDKTPSALLTTVCHIEETLEESTQEEIHKEVESTVAATTEELASENNFKKKKKSEDFDLHKVTGENEKKEESQPEAQSLETIIIKHQNLGVSTEINPDGGFVLEEAKDIKEATDMQFTESTTKSVSDYEAQSALSKSTTVIGEKVDEVLQEQTLKEEEFAAIDNSDRCTPENQLTQTDKFVELNQVVNLPIAMGKVVNTENGEHCDHQSEVTTWESVITKHTISEGMAAKEISTNSSYDVEQQGSISEHIVENSNINDSDKIPPEEAIYVKEATKMDLQNSEVESVPEDKAHSILPSTASVEVETVEEHIQEEILKEGESTDTDAKDIKEGVRSENYFEENKNVLEAFELQETTTENEKKDDPQWEVQSLQTKDIKHPNLEGEATETKPCNDSETNEEVSASPTRDKLEIKEGGNCTQEEAKVMEEATDMQLLETATESFDDEGPSILPTLSIVKGETVEETFLLQAPKDEEPVVTDNNGLCTPKNNLEQTEKAFEDFDTHETMGKVGAENEEHADEESQPLELENAITKNTNSEGMMTTKDNTKTSNEVEEKEMIPRSHSVEDSEINDSSKTLPEQTISMKEAVVDSSKFETESLPENKALSTLPTAESIGVETVMQSIQEEIHKEGESTATNTKEGQKPEDDFEEKKEVPETFELHEAQGNIPQSEAPSLQTIAIKHLDLGDTTKTNTCIDYKENEKLPASHTSEKLEIKDGGKFISEGEKQKEEAIEMQLQESTKESDDKTPSTFSTATMAKGEVVDKVFQEQTFAEEEPTTIDKDGSSGLENEPEETTKLVEEIDLTETKGKVGAENEEQVDYKSKVPSPEIQKTKHANSEGTMTMEGSTTSYEVEQEKIPDSHSLDNLENKDCVTYVELQKSETESLPEDLAMSTLSTTTYVGVETVEESIQEVHREEKSEVIETKVGQRPESDFEEEKKVPENLDLHKTDNTCVETQMNYEVQSLENTAIEHPNSEEDTREITISNDKQESEVVQALQTSEKFEINDKGDFILEEGKGLEEGIEVQLEKYEKEMTGVPDDEASSTFPTSTMVKDETTDETIHELTFKKEDSEVVDTKGSFRKENEHDEIAKEVEEPDIPKTMGMVGEGEEKEQYVDYQSEFPILENLIIQHTNSDEIVRVEGSTKTRYDMDEQEKITESHSAEKSDVKDGGKILPEEAIYIKEATYVELPKSETESVPEDKAQSTLLTTASFSVETVEEIIQPQTLHEEESAAKGIDETSRTENELEQPAEVYGGNDLPETMGKVQSETPTSENTIMRDTVSEGLVSTEISTKSSYDGEYLVVSEYKVMSILPSKAFAGVDIVEESIQEEIHEEEESTATDTEAGHIPENYLVEKEEVFEAFNLHKSTTENVPRLEVQSQETMVIVHPNLEEENRETKLGYDTDDLKQVLVSLTEEKSEIKNEWRFVQAEAKAMEEATAILLDSTKQSVTDDEAPSTLPTLAIGKAGVVKEIIQEETFKEEESATIGYELEQTTIDVETSDLPKIMGKVGAQNEEYTTKHTTTEGLETKEISTESNYDGEKLEKILESHLVDNSQIKDDEKTAPKEAICINKATYVELKSETENVPEDKTLSTFLTTASVEVKSSEENIQAEMHKQIESAVPEIDSDERTKISKASHLHEATLENKKIDELQFEEHSQETIVIENPNLEGDITKTNPHNDTEEPEQVLASNTEEKLVMKDGEKIIHEEAKVFKETNVMQLPEFAEESIPDDKASSTLPSSAIVKGERVEDIIQEQTLKEEKSAALDNDGSCRPEIEVKQTAKFIESIDLPEIMGKVGDENKELADYQSEVCTLETAIKEHPDYQSRALTSDTAISKQTIAEELEAIETSKESSYNLEEPEQKPESHSTTSVRVESIEQSIQEKIYTEAESDLANTEEMWRVENDFKEKRTMVEDIDPYEAAAEYVKKDELQYEAQSTASMLIKQPNIGSTTKTNLSNAIGELQQVPMSDNTENLEIKEGGKYTQEEVGKIEDDTGMQLIQFAKESVADDESLSTLAKYEIVKYETVDESVQEQSFMEETLAAIDNQWSCRPENVLEQTVRVVEEINLPETKINVGEENDQDGSHQSEAPALETIIAKHAIIEGLKTMEIHTKSSYNVEELENIPESHYVENSKIQDGVKTVPIEVIDINEAIDTESAKSKTESMVEGKVLLTLPTTALVGVETIEESTQEEIHDESELTVTDINKRRRTEYDFEEKKTIPKTFDLHKATAENENKDEPQFEVQSLETVLIKHAALEEDTTKTKPSSNTIEKEQGPVSYTAEKSEIQDVGKFILEGEKEMDEANDIQLEESTKRSMPGDEAPSMLPKSAIVKAEGLEEIFTEKTIEEEESTTIENGNNRPENELEQTPKIVEAIDLPETMEKVSVENEEHAKNKTKSLTMDTTIRRYTTSAGLVKMVSITESSYEVDALERIPESSEGLVKMASSTETSYEVEAIQKIPKSSEGLVKMVSSTESGYEVDALEKIPKSQSVENSEIENCGENPTKETTDVQLTKYETEGVPEDKSVSTLPTTTLVGAETFEESTQENIHMEDKSALTHTREWQKPDNGLKENKNVLEAFDQHQDTSNTSAENEKKDEPQSEVQTAQTTVTKFEGETTDKSANSYTEELEMVRASHTRAEIEIKDGEKFMQEEEKKMEEATCAQLPVSAKPSVPNEEALSRMSTLAIVEGESEIVEEIFQEQTLKEEEAVATDNNESCRPKNKLKQTERVVEEIDLPGTMGKLTAENEKQTNHQSEPPTLRNVITTHTNSEGMMMIYSSTKSCYNVKQQEKNVETHTIDNSKNKDAGKTSPDEEATYIKKATSVELAKLGTESVPEKKSLSTLLTAETVRVEIVEESTQINIQKVTKSAVTDTNEEHRPEKDFEEKKVPQAFDVHGVTSNTSAENKKEVEPLSEVQSPETILVKHPNIEGKTTETNPNNYTKELETVPSSSIIEILDMKDGGKSIQEEAKVIKEATGIPEALPALPRSAIVKGETVDEIFEDHTLKEEETAAIDNKKGCRPENQIKQTAEVVEAIDLIETMGKVSVQNKEHAYFLSEALTLENVVPNHIISEGMLTTESNRKSSYDVEKLEKVPQSHTHEISEIKDDIKSSHEEAKYVKEATNVVLHEPEAESVPKDKVLSTTNSISVKAKTIEECIKQEIHEEAKSAMTYDKERKSQENIFEEKEKVPEAFNLQEETDNTCVEHEKNAETQSEEHSVKTMLVKLSNFDGLETKNISPNENTAELENFLATHCGEKLEMEEEEKDMQLAKSKIEIAAKLDAYEQSDVRESAMMDKSELPAEKISIPELPYPSKKVESYPDYEVHDLIKEKLPEIKEMCYNIQDQISESDDHIQGHIPRCEDQIKPEPQMEVEQHLNVPLSAKETSVVGLITKEVHDGVDRAGAIENIEDEHTIDSGNSLPEAQISSTTEETVNQVKGEITKIFKATDPDDDDDDDEQKAKTDLSIKNDLTEKEAATYRDRDEVIESPKEDEVGDEFEKISPSSSGGTVMIKGSRDIDVKEAPHKKSHGILSGVGSKVKHSISKVKKAITGKTSHPKTQSPK